MDKAFAFYMLQSYDDGARISTLYSKINQMAPLTDMNTVIFQAYIHLGKFHNQITSANLLNFYSLKKQRECQNDYNI